jgi:hypothetical protein
MNWSHRRLLVAVAACGATFVVGRVTAAGFPSAGTELFYSGQLTNDAGAPLVTSEELIVQFFDAASGGSELCATDSTEVDLAPTLGGFRLALPAECVSAVQAQGDVWAQLVVSGTRMPRQKLGAAPYAVVAREAQNAAVATTAIEAARARSVVDGSIGTSAIADGAVTAAKTNFASSIQSDVADLTDRMSLAEDILGQRVPERFFFHYQPAVHTDNVITTEVLSPGQQVSDALGSIDFVSSGSVWCVTVAGSASAIRIQADNAGAANCTLPTTGESPLRIQLDDGSVIDGMDTKFSSNAVPQGIGYAPEAKWCLRVPVGQHTMHINRGQLPVPAVVPTGCVNPRITRAGRLTVALEDTGVVP